MEEIRQSIIKDAMAYNIYLTDEYLQPKSIEHLIHFVPQFEREFWNRQISKIKL